MKNVYLLVQRGNGFECMIYAVYATSDLAFTAKEEALVEDPSREMYVMKWCVIGSNEQQPKALSNMN